MSTAFSIPFFLEGGEKNVESNNDLTFKFPGNGYVFGPKDKVVLSGLTFFTRNLWNVLDVFGLGVNVVKGATKILVRIKDGHYGSVLKFLDAWNIVLLPYKISFELTLSNHVQVRIFGEYSVEFTKNLSTILGFEGKTTFSVQETSNNIIDSSIGQTNYKVTCSITQKPVLGLIVFSQVDPMYQLRTPMIGVCSSAVHENITFNITNREGIRIPLSHGKISISGQILKHI